MGIGQQFTLAPAHAHLIFSDGYRYQSMACITELIPTLRTVGCLACTGRSVLVMMPQPALLLLGFRATGPAVAVGSMLSIAGTLSFATVTI